MRAFVCVGFAIILAFALISIVASHCMTCCNGEPCDPELRAQILPN